MAPFSFWHPAQAFPINMLLVGNIGDCAAVLEFDGYTPRGTTREIRSA
jgi:hypothetical protein